MIKVNKIDLHMVCKTWECQIASSAVKMFLDTAARGLSLSFCSQELTKQSLKLTVKLVWRKFQCL